MRRVEAGKLEGESCWKAAGDERAFIAGRGSSWQMKARSDRTRREGEDEAAKPNGVIVDFIKRRQIGTFYLLAQKLVFCNSDFNKSTTVCKGGDLEVSPNPFWIWKH